MDDRRLAEEIKQATSREQVFDSLSEIDIRAIPGRVSSIVEKKLKQIGGDSDIRIALLGNYTQDLLPPYLSTAFAAIELVSDCYFGGTR